MPDETDRRILRHLLAEPDLTTAQLAERAGVTATTCGRRLEKLTSEGVLLGRRAVIDWRKLGYEVEVSLRFTLDKSDPRAFDEFIAAAKQVAEVTEIQTFLGRVDVRLHLIARDMQHYQRLYRSKILSLPHIAEIEPLMQVATISTRRVLPL